MFAHGPPECLIRVYPWHVPIVHNTRTCVALTPTVMQYRHLERERERLVNVRSKSAVDQPKRGALSEILHHNHKVF